jgi:uncharacterized protein YdcH (DUF465 family)
MPDTQALKEHVLQTDTEYRELHDAHRELEVRLRALASKHYLSDAEQLEETTIKKRKLQLKDRMEDILRRRREGVGAST